VPFADSAAEYDGLLRIEHDQNPIVVRLCGEHDFYSAWTLWQGMAEAIETGDADVVADLSAVEFMGVANLAVFLRARELLQQQSRQLVLRALSTRARRVFEVSGLLDIVDEAGGPSLTSSIAGDDADEPRPGNSRHER
jgi:anti-anti-sigma factor